MLLWYIKKQNVLKLIYYKKNNNFHDENVYPRFNLFIILSVNK